MEDPKKDKPKKDKKSKKSKKSKKKSKNKFHVNGTEYSIGIICQMCTEMEAVVHCPECPDFLCEKCDFEKHRHAKRADHVRTFLSQLPYKRAIHLIKWPLKHCLARQTSKRLCRERYRRFYDSSARMYYYMEQRTLETQWHKPFTLKQEELIPLPTPDFSAQKIQSMFRNREALKIARHTCAEVVDKIWSRDAGMFYYHNNSKSPLCDEGIEVPDVGLVRLDRVSWHKPLILGQKELRPLWTDDIAAMMIQGMWKAHLARQFMMSFVRQHFIRIWNPMQGCFMFKNKETGKVVGMMPTLTGKNKWQPDDVREWSTADVVVWVRRLGLKQYVKPLTDFNIYGKLLLCLDWEDFVDMGFNRSIEIKRVLLEYERLMNRVEPGFFFDFKPDETELLRRGAIRQHHRMIRSAIYIQTAFRAKNAKDQIKKFKLFVKLEKDKQAREKQRLESQVWWGSRLPDDMHKFKNHDVDNYGRVSRAEADFSVKDFGWRRDYNSARGWGHWELGSWNGFAEARWHKIDNDSRGLSRKFDEQLRNQKPVIKEHHHPLQFVPQRLKCYTRKGLVDETTTGKVLDHAVMHEAEGPASPNA